MVMLLRFAAGPAIAISRIDGITSSLSMAFSIAV